MVIIRPPLVYGPGVKANFLALMGSVYKKRPLPVAAIRNQRSMVYLDNLVDLILLALEHPMALAMYGWCPMVMMCLLVNFFLI
ncbi:NAD-dependent epimerase/dehydratase family protein [Mangrovibacter sp. SLW1]